MTDIKATIQPAKNISATLSQKPLRATAQPEPAITARDIKKAISVTIERPPEFRAVKPTAENIATIIAIKGQKGDRGEKGDPGDKGGDYETLKNLPRINSIELKGNKELEDIGIDRLTNKSIDDIFESVV